MSDFAQPTSAGSLSYRAAEKRRRARTRPVPAATGGDTAGPAAGSAADEKPRAAPAGDGRSARLDSELRQEIIEEAARLASGH